MKHCEAIPSGNNARLHIGRVRAVLALSVLVHLACVIGFDLWMQNIDPHYFSTGIQRSNHISPLRQNQACTSDFANTKYELEFDSPPVEKGMDSGRRLLRPVAGVMQAR